MNNKKEKFIKNNLAYFRIALEKKPKLQKYYNDVVTSYKNNIIKRQDQVINFLSKLLFSRGSGSKTIIKKIVKLNPLQEFHFGALITMRNSYMQRDKNKLIDVNEKSKLNFVIKAHSLEEAKQIATDEINEDCTFEDSYCIRNVEDIEFVSKINVSQLIPVKTKDGFLRQAKYAKYNDIENCDKYDKKEGFCTFDNFIGIYSKYFKVTKEKLIKECVEFYQNKYVTNTNKLFKEDDDDIKDERYNNRLKYWKPEYGTTPEFWQYYCQKKDISHYCFDISRKVCLKYVSKNKNYPALFYFAMNDHMYLIKDKALCKSLTEKAKAKKDINFSSCMLEQNEVKNIYLGKILSDIPMNKIKSKKSCTIIYSNITDLHELLKDSIKLFDTIPKDIKCKNNKITQFTLKFGKKNYILCLDPNDKSKGLSWKIIKELCDKHNIEFKNQTFVKFIKELRDKFMENKRAITTKEIKDEVIKNYENKCAVCKKTKDFYEIDHILPLASNGSNNIDNLQPLCKLCHKDKTRHEQEDGDYIKISETESSFNSVTRDILSSDLSKNHAFIETLSVKNNSRGKIFHIDVNKCRKNELYYAEDDFCLFTCMDEPIEYNGQEDDGLYFIVSNNYIPLRGNGWYYLPMVKHCLKYKIITESDIKYFLPSSLSIPHDYYNKFIDYCYNNLPYDLSKLAINSMIGAFKPNVDKNKFSSLLCTTGNSQEAYNVYLENKGTYIEHFTVNDVTYYQVFKSESNIKMESEAPIYEQILQLEAIEMHKLIMLVESRNGVVLDLSTDKVICTFPYNIFPFEMDDEVNIKGFYFDDKCTVNRYKLEPGNTRLKYEKKARSKRNETYYLPKKEFKLYEDVKDNNSEPLVKLILDKNESFNIDGFAGTGKTYLIKALQDEMTKRGLNFKSVAPTNKACRLIDGETLNKFVLKCKSKNSINKLQCDYIFVDEISMMKEIFYKYLLSIKMINNKIKFILTGDFLQLEPVNDRVNVDYKNSIALHELCDGNVLNLTTYRRGDKELEKICDFKKIEFLERAIFNNQFTFKHICYTHKKRIEINKNIMDDMLKRKIRNGSNYIEITANINDPHSQNVVLYKDMPIIAHVNCKEKDIFNNETFKIVKVSVESIIVKSDTTFTIVNKKKVYNEIIIRREDFQSLFYPAYAMTIHSVQGETFNEPYTIHQWCRLTTKMKYVAISRATNLKYINII